MAEKILSSVIGLIPVFIVLPMLTQLIQKIQAGTFTVADIIQIVMPVAFGFLLVEVIKGLVGGA
jgi:putative flippase GtrA